MGQKFTSLSDWISAEFSAFESELPCNSLNFSLPCTSQQQVYSEQHIRSRILAAGVTLLYRITRKDLICIGYRDSLFQRRIEIDVSSIASFEMLIDAVTEQLSGANAHKDVVSESWEQEVGGMILCFDERIENPSTLSFADLVFRIQQHDSQCTLSYCAGRLSSKIALVIGRGLIATLTRAIANPSLGLKAFPLFEDEGKVLHGPNISPCPNILSRIEHWAKEAPNNIAIEYSDGKLTYRDLQEKIELASSKFFQMGVGEGTVVGLYLSKTQLLPILILSVMRCGGTFLPLDHGLGMDRLSQILALSNPYVVICDKPLEAVSYQGSVASSDQFFQTGSPGLACCPSKEVSSRYLVFTSGSTGEPAGCLVPYSSISNLAAAMTRVIGLTSRDKFLQVCPVSFDVILEEIFPILWAGGVFVTWRDGLLGGVGALDQVIEAYSITCLELPTVFWHHWVNNLLVRGKRPPHSLKRLLIGGDRVRRDVYESFLAWDVSLYNVYGLSEAACTSTAYVASAPSDREFNPDWTNLPIGSPIGNCDVYIADSASYPLPPGLIGEIIVGGACLGLGYLDSAPTSFHRKYTVVSADSRGPNGYFCTGDLGFIDSCGRIHFLGRIDLQVKVRGVRVELHEIEAKLCEVESIREACVLALPRNNGDTEIIAFIVTTTAELDNFQLQKVLRAQLPAHLRPARLFLLKDIPLNRHGKVDRAALKELYLSKSSSSVPNDITTQIESDLYRIWCEIGGAPEIPSITTNFFDAGADSLLLLEFSTRITADLKVTLTELQLYAAPNIRDLGRLIERKTKGYN